MLLTFVFVIATTIVLRSTFLPTLKTRRQRDCEEHFAFVSGLALDRAGWLYGTTRLDGEDDRAFRKRVAMARASTFAL